MVPPEPGILGDLSDQELGEILRILAEKQAAPERGRLRETLRASGVGAYAASPGECASRRVDLSRPAEEDAAPLPMEEAGEAEPGVWLDLASKR